MLLASGCVDGEDASLGVIELPAGMYSWDPQGGYPNFWVSGTLRIEYDTWGTCVYIDIDGPNQIDGRYSPWPMSIFLKLPESLTQLDSESKSLIVGDDLSVKSKEKVRAFGAISRQPSEFDLFEQYQFASRWESVDSSYQEVSCMAHMSLQVVELKPGDAFDSLNGVSSKTMTVELDSEFIGLYSGSDGHFSPEADPIEGTIRIEYPCVYLYQALPQNSVSDSPSDRLALSMPRNEFRYNSSYDSVVVGDGEKVSNNQYSLAWIDGRSSDENSLFIRSEVKTSEFKNKCPAAQYATVLQLKNFEPLNGLISVEPLGLDSLNMDRHYESLSRSDSDLVSDGLYSPYNISLSKATFDKEYQEIDTLAELINLSDLVFIGRVVDYEHAIEIIPTEGVFPESAVPGTVREDIYDGVIFEITETISGELSPEQMKIPIVVWSLVRSKRSIYTYGIHEPSWEVIEPGVATHLQPDSPLYLVFAANAGKGKPPYPMHYVFATQGGVAPLLEDGRIGTAASGPLADPEHGLTLEDVRAIAAESAGS